MHSITCSIVLYRNTPKQVVPLINSLLQSNLVGKLYLVDNSPTDALKTLAVDTRIEYIFNNKNIGYGAAHNIAMRKAIDNALYHIVLNPDVVIGEGVIESMFNFMEANSATALAAPKTIYPDGRLQYTCRLLPTPFDLIFRRFLPSLLFKKRMERYEMHQGYSHIMEAPYVLGCFMFLRTDALKKTGMFDERFFMYPEDIDLTRRLHQHYKTLFLPFVQVTHAHERGSYKNIKLLWVHIVNMIRYFNKWGWFFDKERKEVNKKILQQFSYNNKSGKG